MSKLEGQRAKLFALKQILEQETDENHRIKMEGENGIIDLLERRYDIKAERKGIYNDIDALNASEILSVEKPHGKERGYYVDERTFELSELKMIVDSIASSKFLSTAKSDELIAKLGTLCSKYQATQLRRSVVTSNRVKNTQKGIFYAVDAINQAISTNKQIQFKYYTYDVKMQRSYMKKGAFYIASPFTLIYTDDNYYLLAYESGKFKHFRVDKMAEVKVLDLIDREGLEEFQKIDMADYSKYTFSMYGGKVERVTMVFQNRMMGTVIDRFGRDMLVMPVDKNHFRITVPVAVSQQFFGWVFGLGKAVRIVEPESVKEQMKKALAEIAERYEE